MYIIRLSGKVQINFKLDVDVSKTSCLAQLYQAILIWAKQKVVMIQKVEIIATLNICQRKTLNSKKELL